MSRATSRLILSVAAVAWSAAIARADAPPSSADPGAEEQASEANLESTGRRSGTSLAMAVGGGMILAKGDLGRGPALSFRLGHVATPRTLVIVEITGGSLLHEPAGSKTILHNDDANFMAGGQYYVGPSVWIRGGGGLGIYTINSNTAPMTSRHFGGAGVVGAGMDLVRWRHIVLDLETFGVMAVTGNGLMLTTGLCFGLAVY